ncbi:MAG TPA: hypothetical protein VFV01_27200 [Spirillospora sp.]|nr:hypothetical protein [Spirillospora sp.]
MAGEIEVRDHSGDDPWPDDAIAALVTPGHVVFNPALESDDLRADLLAFAVAISVSIVVEDTARSGYVAAPEGIVLVTRERLPEPAKGPGRLAGMFARRCGRQTKSATFRIITNLEESDCGPG